MWRKLGKQDEYLRFLDGESIISPSSFKEKMSSTVTDSLRTPLGVIRIPSSVLMDIAPPVPAIIYFNVYLVCQRPFLSSSQVYKTLYKAPTWQLLDPHHWCQTSIRLGMTYVQYWLINHLYQSFTLHKNITLDLALWFCWNSELN